MTRKMRRWLADPIPPRSQPVRRWVWDKADLVRFKWAGAAIRWARMRGRTPIGGYWECSCGWSAPIPAGVWQDASVPMQHMATHHPESPTP